MRKIAVTVRNEVFYYWYSRQIEIGMQNSGSCDHCPEFSQPIPLSRLSSPISSCPMESSVCPQRLNARVLVQSGVLPSLPGLEQGRGREGVAYNPV